VYGPFIDDLGIPMLAGGGRYVPTSNGDMRGPGREGMIRSGDTYFTFFHWHDAVNNGTPSSASSHSGGRRTAGPRPDPTSSNRTSDSVVVTSERHRNALRTSQYLAISALPTTMW
jgi:hypothetical protein